MTETSPMSNGSLIRKESVELVRRHVVGYMIRLRSFVSCLPGNTAVVDRLRGAEGDERVARIVGYILSELGHEVQAGPESQIRREMPKVRRVVTK
jgi:hypothetical protein